MLFKGLLLVFFHIGLVSADYFCACSYDVEKKVYSAMSDQGAPLGYMYEFDCKQELNPDNLASGWIAVAFQHKMGYLQDGPQIQKQTCAGDPPTDDLLKTTKKPATAQTTSVQTTQEPVKTTPPTKPTTVITTPQRTTLTTTPQATTVTTTKQPTTVTTTPQPTTVTTTTQATTITTTSQTTTLTTTLRPTTVTTTPQPTTVTTTPQPTTVTTTPQPTTVTTTPQPTTVATTPPATTVRTTPQPTAVTTTPQSTTVTTTQQPTTVTTTPQATTVTTTPQPTTVTTTPKPTTVTTTPQSTTVTTTPQPTTVTTTPKPTTVTTSPQPTTITSTPQPTTSTTKTTTQMPTTATPRQTTPSQTGTTNLLTGHLELCPSQVVHGAQIGHGLIAQYDTSCYEVVPRLVSWNHAEFNCRHSGGHLVTINSAMEQNFLYHFLDTNYNLTMWIGLHDLLQEENFTWVSGESVSYTNWVTNRKSNNHNNEDCVYMVPNQIGQGKWDDTGCGATNGFQEPFHERHRYICEYHIDSAITTLAPVAHTNDGNKMLCPASIRRHAEQYGGMLAQYKEHCYELLPNHEYSWTHGEQACEAQHGRLAHISDADEQDFILQFMKRHYPDRAVWIGLTDRGHEGTYTWTSGVPVQYTNWTPGHVGNFVDPSREDCVAFIPYQNGEWDDIPCGSTAFHGDTGERHAILCQYRTAAAGNIIG